MCVRYLKIEILEIVKKKEDTQNCQIKIFYYIENLLRSFTQRPLLPQIGFSDKIKKIFKLEAICMKIELSKKDMIKGLKLPHKLTKDLAYICGVLAGDGCLHSRPKKDYEINCGGNPHNEKEFYNLIIKPLLKKTFNLDVKMRLIGNKSTYGFVIYSKALFTFLTERIGLPNGKKYLNLKIPKCFNTTQLKIAFLQGVADTDFSLTLKKTNKQYPHYPVICGASKNKNFILELNKILTKLGFNACLSIDSTYYDKRFNKIYTISRIEVVGHKNLEDWMTRIGFRNPKYLERYMRYKELRKANVFK